jgi:hypothetical protein
MYNCAPQQKANNNFHVTRNRKHGKSSSGSNDDHREVIISDDLKTIISCSTCGRPQGLPCRHVLRVAALHLFEFKFYYYS